MTYTAGIPDARSRSYEWGHTAGHITRRVGKVARDVVTCPTVIFGAGTAVWAWEVAGLSGALVNGGITAVSAGFRAYESWTGKEKGLAPGWRALTYGASCALTMRHGFNEGHLHFNSMHEAWDAMKLVVLPAASQLLASGQYVAQGLHELRKTRPKGTFDDPMFYAGAGDIPAAIGIRGSSSPIAFTVGLAPFVAGFGKSLMKKSDESQPVDSLAGFVSKHTTSSRLYAVGYGVGMVLTGLADPCFAAAQGIWTIGYAIWDKKENRDFIPDLKRLLKKDAPRLAA